VRASLVVISLVMFSAGSVWSQEGSIMVVGRGSFTTESQLFTDPDSPDPLERSVFVPLEDFFGGGVEIRYGIPETHFTVGLSADYIRATQPTFTQTGLPLEDGYQVIPLEVTAYFTIPISGRSADLFMGGGGGVYFGRRIYRLAGVTAETVGRTPGAGIHVLAGAALKITSLLSIMGEMKFRDLQFDSKNAFSVSRITYNGRIVDVSTEPFSSQVHTDGIVFQVGVALTF
jgi:hypothetical protein